MSLVRKLSRRLFARLTGGAALVTGFTGGVFASSGCDDEDGDGPTGGATDGYGYDDDGYGSDGYGYGGY